MSAAERFRKIKKFLKGSLTRNFWAFLFFLALSAGFWLFLTLEDVYEVDIAVPVKLKNVPENVVITTPPPSEINIRVKDHGGQLLRYKYTHSLGSITIDFKDYDTRSGHVALLTSELTRGIVKRLQSSTSIVSFSPDTLEYFYNFGLNKSVPVKVSGNITADSLYCIIGCTTSPSTVKVFAAREILDTLSAVYTTPLEEEDLSERKTVSVGIAPIRGVKTVPDKVKATINVDQMTEKTLAVRIDHTNFPAGKTLKTFPGIVNVMCQVGLKQYREITADKFSIVISYDEVADNTTNRMRLSLKSKPEGVNNVRIVPEEVEFIIEDNEY
ncbi:MAG: YbbR-like domain-containing protein [Bacteroidaceae bacterium]|nr:YbbR-like domain-containing protein [Bacteroidaceae bacterium]